MWVCRQSVCQFVPCSCYSSMVSIAQFFVCWWVGRRAVVCGGRSCVGCCRDPPPARTTRRRQTFLQLLAAFRLSPNSLMLGHCAVLASCRYVFVPSSHCTHCLYARMHECPSAPGRRHHRQTFLLLFFCHRPCLCWSGCTPWCCAVVLRCGVALWCCAVVLRCGVALWLAANT